MRTRKREMRALASAARRDLGLWMALLLVSCSPTAPVDTVESLVADPARLEKVQRHCKLDYARVDADVCAAASEAYRRRFMGDGKAKDGPKE